MLNTITTTGFDAINTVEVALPDQLPLAGLPSLDQIIAAVRAIKHRPARTNAHAQEQARKLRKTSIDEYSTAVLDQIAQALHGPTRQTGDDEFEQLVGDLTRHQRQALTLMDYDEQLRFCQYEQVWGECYKAVLTGNRIKQRMSDESAKLKDMLREDDGSEIPTQQVEQQTERLRWLESRLWYWRAHFKAAHNVYREWVRQNADDFPFVSATFESPEQRAKRNRAMTREKRQTAAQAAAQGSLRRLEQITKTQTPRERAVDRYIAENGVTVCPPARR